MDSSSKTTMSVKEMQQILGLKKTDSYWLVHRQLFDTILVAGKMRVVIKSFEHWYANQIKYKKVNGPPPGAELKEYSYSVQEMADLLGVSTSTVYDILARDHIRTFEVASWKRIRKEDFEAWYRSQTRYRTPEDRVRDDILKSATWSMPEIARLLLIPRNEVYPIFSGKKRSTVCVCPDCRTPPCDKRKL